MNLFEYEGKTLMKTFGIPVPDSVLITEEQAEPPMEFPFMLKAQVLTGGRGKAGGVKKCTSMEEYRRMLPEILHMHIKGHTVYGVLAEEIRQPQEELYVSITLQGVKKPTLIMSRQGGMDVETVAREHPEEILRIEIDPFLGLKDYEYKYLCEKLGTPFPEEMKELIRKLCKMSKETGAKLIEINPLGIVQGHLVAMDSKVNLDEHVYRMKPIIEQMEEERKRLYRFSAGEKEKTTVTYVPLEGNVGLISDGAGTGMLTLDLLHDKGLKTASFAELGGMTSPEVMYRALELTLQGHPEIDRLVIVLIGGFNRMDHMAKGITSYVEEHQVKIPIFCRMCGTMEEEGLRIMHEHGFETYNVLTEMIQAAADYEGRG